MPLRILLDLFGGLGFALLFFLAWVVVGMAGGGLPFGPGRSRPPYDSVGIIIQLGMFVVPAYFWIIDPIIYALRQRLRRRP